MGRLKANTNPTSHQDYSLHVKISSDHHQVLQAPESDQTNYEVPASQTFESQTFHEDLYPQETPENEPEPPLSESQHISQHTTFSLHHSQPQLPQAFPPPQAQPQAFSQANNQSQPQSFPPPQVQHNPQAHFQEFPTTQALPQIFVPHNHHMPVLPNYSQPQSSANSNYFQQPNMVQFPPGGAQVAASPVNGTPTAKPLPPTDQTWNTDLFGCMEDPTNALITACFPCVTFGQIAEILDYGQTSCATSGLLYGLIAFFIAMPCIMSCTYRTKLRNKYGLMEAPGQDWLVHCFCECCALCQEYRELQYRGIDPSIGWLGNKVAYENMQVQQATMVPPRQQNMMG